jgi:hypothetical protein
MCPFNLKNKRGFEKMGRNFSAKVDVGSHTNTQLSGVDVLALGLRKQAK